MWICWAEANSIWTCRGPGGARPAIPLQWVPPMAAAAAVSTDDNDKKKPPAKPDPFGPAAETI